MTEAELILKSLNLLFKFNHEISVSRTKGATTLSLNNKFLIIVGNGCITFHTEIEKQIYSVAVLSSNEERIDREFANFETIIKENYFKN